MAPSNMNILEGAIYRAASFVPCLTLDRGAHCTILLASGELVSLQGTASVDTDFPGNWASCTLLGAISLEVGSIKTRREKVFIKGLHMRSHAGWLSQVLETSR